MATMTEGRQVETATGQYGTGGGAAMVEDVAACLLDAIGRLDFQDRLMQGLKQHVAFDAGLVLLYRDGAPPRILYNEWRDGKGLADIQHYLRGPYRIDPFYRLASTQGADGLYRLSQIDPAFLTSRYYREYFRYCGLRDEVNAFVTLDPAAKIALSLARETRRAPFSDADIEKLQSVMPLLGIAVCRHFRELRPQSLDDDGLPLQNALAQAVKNFGRSVLTERECQVAQLILYGYSVKGAAEKLAISPATVKLHRRNLYSKLDISSQTALFSLFIDSVSSSRGVFEDPLDGYLTRRSPLTGATQG